MTVAGFTPRALAQPASIEEFADCLAALYAHDTPYAFAGGETELDLGNAPHALDTLVRTTGCDRVIDYAPEDQTITVEAGMTLAAVGQLLARERQFLAIDAPEPSRTTIGGAIATNLYGRRRLRYGSIKDTIVGVEIVRPDGVRARGGGKVVKNVAGFDMPKLMVGSLGSLGAIVSATFRVHPIEERRAALVYIGLDIAGVMRLSGELVSGALVPASVVALAAGAERYDCEVAFEGFARGVDQQLAAARAIATRLVSEVREGAVGAVADVERAARRGAAWHVTISARPTALASFLAATSFGAARLAVYPMLGVAFVGSDTLDAATVAQWRTALNGGSVVVNALPPDARGSIDAWGTPSTSALSIMRRLKHNFDPKGLCNAGRFVGGL